MELKLVEWNDAKSILRNIRTRVFIEEQNVPEELEWDGEDSAAMHIVGQEGNRPVACARIFPDGKLGRIAVLKAYRGHGWGNRILRFAEQHMEGNRGNRVYLDAQAAAYAFYFRNGYRPEEEMFWDADIPHLRMSKVLNRPDSKSQQYHLREDDTRYESDQPAAAPAWFQIAAGASRRSIIIRIHDLNHPLFNNTSCISELTGFIRRSDRSHIKLIISHEIPGLSEHPLLHLQHRMSSRFDVKINEQNEINQILFDDAGYLNYDYEKSACCFYDPGITKRHRSRFDQLWGTASSPVEGRRLKI